ncbi:Uncharacterised protein [Shewanella morhuae]|uniref:Uncharacterized protein n=1 Tax=Shewanella morhuae TaxID=365591 RepID=A0A380BVQ0_9GAMM|nr:Uncharacterised protein [Shewanella morhuae]
MTTKTQQPSAQQSEVNEEILRLAKHIPSDSTIFIMRCTFLFIICIVATLLLSWMYMLQTYSPPLKVRLLTPLAQAQQRNLPFSSWVCVLVLSLVF